MSLKGKSMDSKKAQVRGTLNASEVNAKKAKRPDYNADMPQKPKGMTSGAVEYWDEIVPQLYHAGVLTKLDTVALQILCETYVTWKNAVQLVNKNKNGALVMDHKGEIKEAPEHKIMRQSEKRLIEMLSRFGMEPSGRKKITKVEPGKDTKPQEASEWDEFL